MPKVVERLQTPPVGWPRLWALAQTPFVRLGIRAATLLLAYLVLERWLMGVARLPEASYAGPVIAAGVLQRFLVEPAFAPGYLLRIGVVAALMWLLVARFATLRAPWSRLEQGALLRLMVVIPTLLLAWDFATYDYNLYYDRSHLVDRLALGALGGLVLWRPVFVLPFAVMAVAVIGQFNHPIGGYSVAEPFLLVRWLLLFAAFFLARAAGTGHRPGDFAFLTFTLLAASYFVSGLGKIRLDWFTQGDVALLLPATFANGWLGFLDHGTVGALTRGLARVDWMLVAGMVVFECAAVLCLLRRGVFLFFLAAWPVFHLSVFALSGIFFWKWIVLEVAILLLLLKRPDSALFEVFSRRHFVLSIPLIVGGTIWFQPANLSWYNAAVSYVYRFEGVGESGRRYSLPPAFFAPYDYQFTLGAFAYISPYRQLDVVWGATRDRALATAMASAGGPGDVEVLERERGQWFFDADRTGRLEAFLQRFVGTYNERGSKRTLLGALAPPPHLWTFAGPDAFDGSEAITRVVVRQVASFFDGRGYVELGPRPLRSVDIPSMAARSTSRQPASVGARRVTAPR